MKTLFLFLIIVCNSVQLLAQSPSANQSTLTTKNVTIFKNGLCMFTKEGTLPLSNGSIKLPVPDAISSTYWLGVVGGEKVIKNIIFSTDTIKTPRNAESWDDLFRASIGKQINLTLRRTETINDSSYFVSQNINGKLLRYMKALNSVQLENPSGTRIIKLNGDIIDATLGGEASYTTDSTARFAIITPIKPVKELSLQELSLRNGVTWIPSYYLKFSEAKNVSNTSGGISIRGGRPQEPTTPNDTKSDTNNTKKEARIEMKALIENYADDIINSDVELVVGLPQLYFSTALDPATYQQSFLASTGMIDNNNRNSANYAPTSSVFAKEEVQVKTGNFGAAYGNTVGGVVNQVARQGGLSIRGSRPQETQILIDGQDVSDKVSAGGSGLGSGASRAGSNYAPTSDIFSTEAFSPESAEQSADFFIYKLNGISIPKDKKGSASVFAATITYSDKYECSIPDFVNFQQSRYINTQVEHNYDVFHSIELNNSSEYPLTSAGIVVVDEKNRFLTQDQLKYIPKGGKGFVRLSRELNVKVKSGEEEVAREENAEKINKIRYNKVTIKGSILLSNYNDKEMTVTIKKNINGSVTKAGEGKAKKLIENRGVNPFSELTFEISIPANGKKELNYEYEALFQQ